MCAELKKIGTSQNIKWYLISKKNALISIVTGPDDSSVCYKYLTGYKYVIYVFNCRSQRVGKNICFDTVSTVKRDIITNAVSTTRH